MARDTNAVRARLASAGIDFQTDFHTLRSDKVELLLAEANNCGYRRPKTANGSKARYFFSMLARHANSTNSKGQQS